MAIGRKEFLKKAGYLSAASLVAPGIAKIFNEDENSDLFFNISLAQWSLHRSFFDGEMDPMEFPTLTKERFGISAVEYVNTFYFDRGEDQTFLRELKSRSEEAGVRNLLIMCDREGSLGDADADERKKAVENHYKWVDAAAFLGCHSIRVNAAGEGTEKEVAGAATEGLSMLSDYAGKQDINVIVENHGGYSSDASWLVGVIEGVGRDNCGTLPDFGNFRISDEREYDMYRGVRELMPHAKGVSAKSYDFDRDGNETTIDFRRMLKIVKDAGFTGYIGIEYEGDSLGEPEGIKATKELLTTVGRELSE